jgi:hypothetical protein
VHRLAPLAALLILAGCGGDSEPATPTATAITEPPGPPPAPPGHATLEGPHLDGAISAISDRSIRLHILPERRRRPEVTFVVPDPPPPGVDLQHLRSDASAGVTTRIFYRRSGGRLVLRGYTHPPPASE